MTKLTLTWIAAAAAAACFALGMSTIAFVFPGAALTVVAVALLAVEARSIVRPGSAR